MRLYQFTKAQNMYRQNINIPKCKICTNIYNHAIILVYDLRRLPPRISGGNMDKNYKFGIYQSDKNIDLTIFQYG